MKKHTLFLLAGIAGLMVTGCAQKTPVNPTTAIITETTMSETTTTAVPETTTETATAQTDTTSETAKKEQSTEETIFRENYKDNFDVDAEAAEAFARRIKEVVAAKDLEGLADLTAFPTYTGFTDGGKMIETREAFIALGADKIFTAELLDSIAAADESSLSASMAGFALSKENGAPNVVFGVRDGKLVINGINY